MEESHPERERKIGRPFTPTGSSGLMYNGRAWRYSTNRSNGWLHARRRSVAEAVADGDECGGGVGSGARDDALMTDEVNHAEGGSRKGVQRCRAVIVQ